MLLFRQGDFIEHAIGNLKEAIRDGAIMVTIVIFLFLLNFRTTFITLMAMPLSFAITMLVFKWFGISVNSMTLGGLAVAIGMVVDDAIVDVENVFRRLRENAALPQPQPRLEVIARASGEVRNSILYATLLIILVFLPLLGPERRGGPALRAHRHRHHRLDDRVVRRLAHGHSRCSARSCSGRRKATRTRTASSRAA